MSLWFKELPPGWEEAPLKSRLARNDGGVWGEDPDGSESDTIVLRSTEQRVDGAWNIEAPAVRKLSKVEAEGGRLEVGDLVVTKSSGSELHIGKTSLVTAEVAALNACYSNFMQRLRVDGRTEPRFVHYWMNNELCREQFAYLSNSTSGLANLNGTVLGTARLAFPLKDEQERIANFLDVQTARIDALIAEKETLQQRLGEYRLSAITSALSGGLIPYDSLAETGEYWFATVPSHWAFCPLNYRYEVQLGKMLDEKRITGDHLLPYLRNVDVQWGQINTEGLPQMDIHPEEHERYTVRPGDLLVCEGGDVGRAAIWEGNSQVFAFQKALHRVRPRTGNDLPKYLFYLLFDSAKRGRFADREKATIAHLTAEAFRRYRFPFPPREEQEEIVGRLDATMASIDRLLDHVNEHVDRLREYRSSLISTAVTGQLDLSTFKAVA